MLSIMRGLFMGKMFTLMLRNFTRAICPRLGLRSCTGCSSWLGIMDTYQKISSRSLASTSKPSQQHIRRSVFSFLHSAVVVCGLVSCVAC
ncbi:hypothetical protein PVAP13_8KG016580 [Panicum virgatum]|uniref:Uncharacterized protein n=1 Tax=Panicum virgatum TaxID=38727 RepID=A0A8T0PD67_PANVG|nr:hypothetical protein PVAP13_8KG016580 [Panicum virgatum]KAG2559814.1 hypothetical protein PVAP13_8KG016580 [Panicum virgatum]KAG2559815.1 hypothetical protein PVAP13_8KG016580 [Panicum virgatum]